MKSGRGAYPIFAPGVMVVVLRTVADTHASGLSSTSTRVPGVRSFWLVVISGGTGEDHISLPISP